MQQRLLDASRSWRKEEIARADRWKAFEPDEPEWLVERVKNFLF